ncbi:unnamed protein product, partial [Closterium sp. Yama58-4]
MGFVEAEDFGQHVDLTQRIREVLANYPEGTTILKELIQNADDAGASKVSFCLDHRTHGLASLAYAPLAQFQGPALLVHNDAVFSDEDFASISRVGDSGKRKQSWKTGRFGIGFNSVYHLTDLPSFVSRQFITFFDPHCAYLPRVSAANPGKRIDFVAARAAMAAQRDQFSPYCAFGCDMQRPFAGTLFRFPLRTEEQAGKSKLSRQAYNAADMAALLREFEAEAVSSLLFLKHVDRVDVLEWHQGATAPVPLFSCRITSPDSSLRFHRQAFSRLARPAAAAGAPGASGGGAGAGAVASEKDSADFYEIGFVCESFSQGKREGKDAEAALGTVGRMARRAAEEYDIHLVPWASVAARVDCDGDTNAAGAPVSSFQGRAFCFLPLPVRPNLPVHINGYFELSSNRRDIWKLPSGADGVEHAGGEGGGMKGEALQVAHPSLREFVRPATGAGVLDALQSAADWHGVPFATLFQMAEAALDSGTSAAAAAAAGGGGAAAGAAGGAAGVAAPAGVEPALLGESFLCPSDDREAAVLSRALAIPTLPRPAFFKMQVLARVQALPPGLRNRTMLAVLQELPQLCTVDPGLRDVVANLAFVPAWDGKGDGRQQKLQQHEEVEGGNVAGGFAGGAAGGAGAAGAAEIDTDIGNETLCRPVDLYDSRNPELCHLLQGMAGNWFPAAPFSSSSALEMLLSVGLRSAVTTETILSCARAVESIAATDAAVARERGRVLLSYLDVNAARWVPVAQGGRWARPLTGSVLAAQLLELGRVCGAEVADKGAGKALAGAVPRIYTMLSDMLGQEEMEVVKAILE